MILKILGCIVFGDFRCGAHFKSELRHTFRELCSYYLLWTLLLLLGDNASRLWSCTAKSSASRNHTTNETRHL